MFEEPNIDGIRDTSTHDHPFFDLESGIPDDIPEILVDVLSKVTEAIVGDVFNIVGHWAVDMIIEYIQTPTNLEGSLSFLSTLMSWATNSAFVLATIMFIARIMFALKENLVGEKEPNFAEILGSLIISGALILLVPYALQNFLIKVNNSLIYSLAGIFDFSSSDLLNVINSYEGANNIWVTTIIWVILLVCFVLLALTGVIRFVELIVLLILGPVMAVSYVNRSESLRVYWTEAIAVVFTQSIHFLLVIILFKLIATDVGTTNGLKDIFLAIAVTFVAFRGPAVLRKYLHNSGVGSAIGGLGRVAAYRVMAGIEKGFH